MHVLMVGHSSLARRRILPALAAFGVERIDVASRTRAAHVRLPPDVPGTVFSDYEDAIDRSGAALVYISTHNANHAELATRALDRGAHVIVDKPACLSLADAERLVERARVAGRCLAEATVFGHHPLFAAIADLFAEAGTRPTRIAASFSFPPLPDENYRHVAALGGGTLLDLGVYAVAPGRLLFGAAPDDVTCRIVERGREVETSISVLLGYPGGRSMVGHYGMTTAYVNRLDVFGPAIAVSVERALSPPPDVPLMLHVNHRDKRATITVPAADAFVAFLRWVVRAIEGGDLDEPRRVLLADAAALDQLRRAAR